jgi:hypothetical protein
MYWNLFCVVSVCTQDFSQWDEPRLIKVFDPSIGNVLQIDQNLNSWINKCKNTVLFLNVFYVYLIVFTQVLKLILWFRNKLRYVTYALPHNYATANINDLMYKT